MTNNTAKKFNEYQFNNENLIRKKFNKKHLEAFETVSFWWDILIMTKKKRYQSMNTAQFQGSRPNSWIVIFLMHINILLIILIRLQKGWDQSFVLIFRSFKAFKTHISFFLLLPIFTLHSNFRFRFNFYHFCRNETFFIWCPKSSQNTVHSGIHHYLTMFSIDPNIILLSDCDEEYFYLE